MPTEVGGLPDQDGRLIVFDGPAIGSGRSVSVSFARPLGGIVNEIIVGVDGSATAKKAALAAVEMATSFNRPLHIVTSMTRNSSQEIRGGGSESWHIDSVGVAEDLLRALEGELKATTPVTHAVVMSDPASALCDEATRLEASVIVVGNRRVQGAARVLGSIAGDVAKRAPCNVYIVHTTGTH